MISPPLELDIATCISLVTMIKKTILNPDPAYNLYQLSDKVVIIIFRLFLKQLTSVMTL